jgi:hypothetical protein
MFVKAVFLDSPPFSPSQTGLYFALTFLLFKRGREYERGRSPLSLKLPSPAIKTTGYKINLAGEGIKG